MAMLIPFWSRLTNGGSRFLYFSPHGRRMDRGTSTYVDVRRRTSTYVDVRRTSSSVNIRQCTSAYVNVLRRRNPNMGKKPPPGRAPVRKFQQANRPSTWPRPAVANFARPHLRSSKSARPCAPAPRVRAGDFSVFFFFPHVWVMCEVA